LGLRFPERFGQEYYISQLRPAQVALIKETEQRPSLLDLVNEWLERTPFFNESAYWKTYTPLFPVAAGKHPFWSDYSAIYANSLVEGEKGNLAPFEKLFFDENTTSERRLSARASRAALFIMLYRGYPLLQLPFQLLNNLLEIDEQLSTWRYRHLNMVTRMIGLRTGTGGSSGQGYLKGALDKHYIFREIAALNSYLIERKRLPQLSKELEHGLGF
jgi:tryptophan 2,3-dioxygenase